MKNRKACKLKSKICKNVVNSFVAPMQTGEEEDRKRFLPTVRGRRRRSCHRAPRYHGNPMRYVKRETLETSDKSTSTMAVEMEMDMGMGIATAIAIEVRVWGYEYQHQPPSLWFQCPSESLLLMTGFHLFEHEKR